MDVLMVYCWSSCINHEKCAEYPAVQANLTYENTLWLG